MRVKQRSLLFTVVAVILLAMPALADTRAREEVGLRARLVEWVGTLLGQFLDAQTGTYSVSIEADSRGGASPQGSGCIDPNGRPRPCE